MGNYIPTGRGSRHSGIPYNMWQRHTAQCEERNGVTLNTNKRCDGSCTGKDGRREKRFHALATSCVITGERVRLDGKGYRLMDVAEMDPKRIKAMMREFMCPLTGEWVTIPMGDVDRIITGANGGRYEPGNIAFVAASANEARNTTTRADERYRADAMAASARWINAYGEVRGKRLTPALRALVVGQGNREVVPDPDSLISGPYGA